MNWKTAAGPLAALTVALAVGVGYFAGSSGDVETAAGAAAKFQFEQGGPTYAPGSRQAAPAQQAGSSIDMFRSANKGYASEADSGGGEPAARRPKDKKALQEFLRQARHDINMDPAGMAAQAAAAGQDGAEKGRTITNPAAKGGAQKEQQAAGAAVHSRQGAAAATRSGSMNSRRGSFSSGRFGSSLSGGGSGTRLNGRAGSSFGGDGGGQNQDTDYAMSSGGGRDLEAGAYGSHGGGAAPAANFSGGDGAGAGQSGGGKAGAGGPPQEKKVPEAVAFLWPRTFDFGDMYMYETAARQVILMNIGDAAMKVGKIGNMDEETPFYVEKDKCSRTALAPGKSCTFTVRFSPKAVRDYVTGFEVPTNDGNALNYQGVIEVKGNSKYSYSTWWWHHYWSGPAGYNNRLYFGLVPEGYTMDEVLRITNNTGAKWKDLKLDRSGLPGSFRITGDGCTGSTLGPHQSCAVTVTFAPSAGDNRRFSSAYYGQYHAVNYQTGAKSYSARPRFPPLVLEKPVEAAPKGKLAVRANFNVQRAGQVVAVVPIGAESSAPFPVMGLQRIQHYYFFK